MTTQPNHFLEMKSAIRRCQTMGKFHAFIPAFNDHPLAACIDNHNACIEAEEKDAFSILVWLLNMARAINRFCNAIQIKDDPASQYWLERFLWCLSCCRLVDVEILLGIKK